MFFCKCVFIFKNFYWDSHNLSLGILFEFKSTLKQSWVFFSVDFFFYYIVLKLSKHRSQTVMMSSAFPFVKSHDNFQLKITLASLEFDLLSSSTTASVASWYSAHVQSGKQNDWPPLSLKNNSTLADTKGPLLGLVGPVSAHWMNEVESINAFPDEQQYSSWYHTWHKRSIARTGWPSVSTLNEWGSKYQCFPGWTTVF